MKADLALAQEVGQVAMKGRKFAKEAAHKAIQQESVRADAIKANHDLEGFRQREALLTQELERTCALLDQARHQPPLSLVPAPPMDVDPKKPGRSPLSSFLSLPSISSGPFHHPALAITPHPVDPKAHLHPRPNQRNRKNPVSFYGNTQETIDAVLNSIQRMRPDLPPAVQMTMSMLILQKAGSPPANTQKRKEPMLPQQPLPPTDPSKLLTWCQKETRKGAISHPTAKGTNSAELHFSLPKSAATERLFSSHSMDLLAQFLGSMAGHLTDEQLVLFDENSLVAA